MTEVKKCEECGQIIEEKKCGKCEKPIIEEPKVIPTKKVIQYAILFLLGVTIISFLPFTFYGGYPEGVNNFGDSFGFANAFVSACAFAALIMTMFWQKQELEQQRHEIRQMREASQESAKAQGDSYEALRQASRLSALATLREAAQKLADVNTRVFVDKSESMIVRNRIEAAILRQLDSFDSLENYRHDYEMKVIEINKSISELQLAIVDLSMQDKADYSKGELNDEHLKKSTKVILAHCSKLHVFLHDEEYPLSVIEFIQHTCSDQYCKPLGLEPMRIDEVIESLHEVSMSLVKKYRPISSEMFISKMQKEGINQ
ncbi:hypothetical protein [Rubinisphaera italica]|uniref:Uncharacterized protein n=1 Tax=Rubinisphaera italica TaxID=2527969 RepID=A0A5C5XJG4_9PLAN|nr:hypothetical protein [Rubinisphaera italica]TWT62868.1 hypothetical protein Pan54_36140 [Rubinisphaera italica]